MTPKIMMMTLVTFGCTSFSLADSNCDLIKKASLAIAVHASNFANSNTTRTPEGGAYKRKSLTCDQAACEIQEHRQFKMLYQPGHPDANPEGYVQTPAIDKNKESILISAQAQILRQLGANCPKLVKVSNLKNSAIIEYKTGSVKFDILNFKDNNNLSTWVRESADGQTRILNF